MLGFPTQFAKGRRLLGFYPLGFYCKYDRRGADGAIRRTWRMLAAASQLRSPEALRGTLGAFRVIPIKPILANLGC